MCNRKIAAVKYHKRKNKLLRNFDMKGKKINKTFFIVHLLVFLFNNIQ